MPPCAHKPCSHRKSKDSMHLTHAVSALTLTLAPATCPAAGPAGAQATTQAPVAPVAREEQPAASRDELAEVRTAGLVEGLDFDADELELMTPGVLERREDYATLRALGLDNAVAPAFGLSSFLDRLARRSPVRAALEPVERAWPQARRPAELADLCYADVMTLASLVRAREVSCVELVELHLDRLERLDRVLRCTVTALPERALERARALDRELDEGRWRGPLHGIPFGAKDLLALRGAPTTWGAEPYRDQVLDLDATVITRLEDAGAVLIAKLALGELAWGDEWFGGMTRNPWNPEEGSSGSSAGPAAATAAGGVVFAIGSETYGSIVTPSARCGCSSLRPSFGRVSRHGAMALSWTMDKLGPMCRSMADASIVTQAIAGLDPLDDHTLDRPYRDLGPADVSGLRVGYPAGAFRDEAERAAVFGPLEQLGITPVAVALPDIELDSLMIVLQVEAAAAFDELTTSGRDDLLVRQVRAAWPNVFREARLIPAVEYVNANRMRRLLAIELERLFDEVDVLVHESQHVRVLAGTNLTGHPTAVVPTAVVEGQPGSVSFTAGLYDDARLVALAEAWQRVTGHHLQHPDPGPLMSAAGAGTTEGRGD